MDENEKRSRDVFIETQDRVTPHVDPETTDEDVLPKLAALEGDGLVKSRFDELSIRQTVWLFKVSAFYCFIAYTSSVMEGFSVGFPKSSEFRQCSYCSAQHVGQYHHQRGICPRGKLPRE